MTDDLIAHARKLVAHYDRDSGQPSLIEREILTGVILGLCEVLERERQTRQVIESMLAATVGRDS